MGVTAATRQVNKMEIVRIKIQEYIKNIDINTYIAIYRENYCISCTHDYININNNLQSQYTYRLFTYHICTAYTIQNRMLPDANAMQMCV